MVEFAFYKPTISTIEVGMEYLFKMVKFLHDKTIFPEIEKDLVEETITMIEMIMETE